MATENLPCQTKEGTLLSFHFPTMRTIALTLLISLTVGWTYSSTLAYLLHRWNVAPEYSHGYLVPLFSLVILWFRWPNKGEKTKNIEKPWTPSWWALVPLTLTAALYLGGTWYYYTWLVQISLLPALAAVTLALAGRQALKWAWPAILFLLFMIPLPARLDQRLAGPLQHCATVASTNALQTLGFFAHDEGNIILMRHGELGVVEACSGLRMLMVFFAASTAVVIIQRRSLIQTILILLSAVPIALLCNILRITFTGMLQETVSSKAANFVFHDAAGWLMIPLALLFLGLEMWFLSHLFIPINPEGSKRQATPRPAFDVGETAVRRSSDIRLGRNGDAKSVDAEHTKESIPHAFTRKDRVLE